jgi:large subunit ribosomal protein L30
MIIVIRITGRVDTPKKVDEALFRLRIRRKYTATILKGSKEDKALLKKIRDYVAYGEISAADLEKLVEARGQSLDKKKVDAKSVSAEIEKSDIIKSKIKPYFRLHPPRKGIMSKLHFGVKKGVLGDHGKEIAKLMERML